MTTDRRIQNYCTTCLDVRTHLIAEADPGSCTCLSCGAVQPLMVPVGSGPDPIEV